MVLKILNTVHKLVCLISNCARDLPQPFGLPQAHVSAGLFFQAGSIAPWAVPSASPSFPGTWQALPTFRQHLEESG